MVAQLPSSCSRACHVNCDDQYLVRVVPASCGGGRCPSFLIETRPLSDSRYLCRCIECEGWTCSFTYYSSPLPYLICLSRQTYTSINRTTTSLHQHAAFPCSFVRASPSQLAIERSLHAAATPQASARLLDSGMCVGWTDTIPPYVHNSTMAHDLQESSSNVIDWLRACQPDEAV